MRFDHVPAQWRERDWLIPFAVVTAAQFLFWLAQFALGLSPMLAARGYTRVAMLALIFVVGMFAVANVVMMIARREPKPLPKLAAIALSYRSRLAAAVAAAMLVSIGGSAFSASKSAMILAAPPYADPFLAALDRAILGQDGWELFRGFPYMAELNRLYTFWGPIQVLAIFGMTLVPPSREKAQALVCYVSCWLLLGTLAAYAFSSVGPVFYDRVIGGGFVDLPRYLQGTDSGRISEWLWEVTRNGSADVAEGISAMPSMHVAMTLWLALVLRRTPIAFLAWFYLLVICVGSVALGWHYASDALVSIIGVALIWKLSGRIVDARLGQRRTAGQSVVPEHDGSPVAPNLANR